ncbi:NAD kinase [Pedobacter sp. HMF7647]|uniref:NAD kinase n=1 Tax=Hufsiella arboris TaxID=2695275 RepID=A0A7K1YBE1_9SPHI|nr:NAD kinase [Hufsiella arboris]MXV51419.1 NAD kinase [Hufsiella arboris]
MRIAIYGREISEGALVYVQHVFDILNELDTDLIVYSHFAKFCDKKIKCNRKFAEFSSCEDLKDADVLLSLGGDGTMLDTVTLIRDTQIPVMGINLGRLGFLASVKKEDIKSALIKLVNKEFSLDSRVLLKLSSENNMFGDDNFALNDITIHRRDNSAMMIIHAYLNGEFLNSYWADGLIIATPTGSTAYSLSCGGPIVFPQSGNFIVTPISPHNLNVRPVILSDTNVLSFEIEGRSSKYLVSCDSRTEIISNAVKLSVNRAEFKINLVRLNNESYLSTLRNKLLWGIDTRNY